jgi:hypothetical protein
MSFATEKKSEDAREKVLVMLETSSNVDQASVRISLETVIYLSELQLLFPTSSEDAINDIDELSACLEGLFPDAAGSKKKTKKTKKKKKEEKETEGPEPISVLNDLLLSLLMRPQSPCQRLLRDASKAVYSSLSAANMLNHRDCILSLAETLVNTNLHNGEEGDESSGSEDEDEDEFKPIDPKEVERIKAKYAKEEAEFEKRRKKKKKTGDDDDGDGDEVMLTEESDLAAIMGLEDEEEKNKKNKNKNKNEDSSEDDSEDDSDDDERDPNDDTGLFGQTASEMMMNAFQLLSKRVQKDQAKSMQIDEIQFKLRVVDLVDGWVKINSSSTFVPTVLLMPMCNAIVDLTVRTQKSLDAASSTSSFSSSSSSSSS